VNHAIDLAVGCRYFLPGCGYLRSFHQMALLVNGSTHLIPALLLMYRPRKDERLSWPSWLTCSGRLTHISGHPSAAGRAQDRESSPVRDRRSTTVPRHTVKCRDNFNVPAVSINPLKYATLFLFQKLRKTGLRRIKVGRYFGAVCTCRAVPT